MKLTHCLLTIAILAMPAMAQPARDVFDAHQMVRAQERSAPLHKELRAMLTAARKILDDARVGPPLSDVTAIRERLHHNFIHSLQRRAVQTVGQIDTIIGMYEGTIRGVRPAQAGVINSVAQGSADPAK